MEPGLLELCRPALPQSQALAANVINEIAYPAGISPLIVVPGDYLDAIACHHSGHGSVHYRGTSITFKVGGNEFVFLES
jgi:hypothetical protein